MVGRVSRGDKGRSPSCAERGRQSDGFQEEKASKTLFERPAKPWLRAEFLKMWSQDLCGGPPGLWGGILQDPRGSPPRFSQGSAKPKRFASLR